MVTVLKYGSKKEAIKRLLERPNQQTDSKGLKHSESNAFIRKAGASISIILTFGY